MGKYCAYNDEMWACDFETTTNQTQFYKDTNQTKVWLAYAKKFNCKNEKFEPDEILTTTIEEFFDQFFLRAKSTTLFFHNLSWDGEFIKWYLHRNGYQYFHTLPERKNCKGWTILEDTSRIYYMQVFKPIRTKKGIKRITLYIRCSLNLLTLSIDQIAKVYGLENKKEINYHVEPFEKIEDVDNIFIEYIKRDVDIMIPPLIQYNQIFATRQGNRTTYGLAKLTISSTALQMFKHFNYKKYNFKENFTLDYDLIQELKHWYSGGLTTFSPQYQYKITEQINGHVYDVNSMYPSVMVDFEYPIGVPEKTKKDYNYKIRLIKIFIIEANIKSENYPALMRPWKSIMVNYPPHTRFIRSTKAAIAYYFEDELESLKRFYDIQYEIMDEWWFKSEPYFKDFINHYYDKRKEYKKKKDPREQTMKLLLNSAYGKFGQKPDKPSLIYSLEKYENGDSIFIDNVEYIVDVVREQANCVGDLYSYVCECTKHKDKTVNLVIAACITKNARLKLHDAIYHNLDNFLYCDTDSVFLKAPAVGIEIDENKLGAWKCEAEFDGFELGGAKLYNLYLRDVKIKSAHAGVNKKWGELNLQKGDIIEVNKVLDIGSKKMKRKIEGGIILEETNFTLKHRS